MHDGSCEFPKFHNTWDVMEIVCTTLWRYCVLLSSGGGSQGIISLVVLYLMIIIASHDYHPREAFLVLLVLAA